MEEDNDPLLAGLFAAATSESERREVAEAPRLDPIFLGLLEAASEARPPVSLSQHLDDRDDPFLRALHEAAHGPAGPNKNRGGGCPFSCLDWNTACRT